MADTRIHLVRHGEVANPRRILYGRLPGFKLTPRGREQVERTARYLAKRGLAGIFSSPMLRARQTAVPIARYYPDLPIHISRWLNEVFTEHQGKPGAVLDARGGDVYSDTGPDSEQPADIVARLEKFIVRILKEYHGRVVAGVTHGDVITFGVIQALGAELNPQNKSRLQQIGFPAPYPAHASVTTLIYKTRSLAERPRIEYLQP